MSSADATPILTAAQCRAARALLDWSQAALAGAAGVTPGTVRDLEAGVRAPYAATQAKLRAALEAAGIVLIADGALEGAARRLTGRSE